MQSLRSLVAVALLFSAVTAKAANSTDSAAVHISSPAQDLGGYAIDGFEPASLSVFHLNVTAAATWSANLNETISFDPNDVRQGAALNVARGAVPSGSIHVLWRLTGAFRPLDLFDVPVDIPISADAITCAPRLSGSGYTCTATSASVTLVETPCLPLAPWVDLVLEVNFDIDPVQATADRTFAIGGDPAVADL